MVRFSLITDVTLKSDNDDASLLEVMVTEVVVGSISIILGTKLDIPEFVSVELKLDLDISTVDVSASLCVDVDMVVGSAVSKMTFVNDIHIIIV